MRHLFTTATLLGRRPRPVSNVMLDVVKGKRSGSVSNPFLNGTLDVRGHLLEECRSGDSYGKPGKQLKIQLAGSALDNPGPEVKTQAVTALDVVLTRLLQLSTPLAGRVRPNGSAPAARRRYQWEFVVVAQCNDSMQLFQPLLNNDGELTTTDLVALLGLDEELPVARFNAEGGFMLAGV
jgi:hypothetical protein